MTAITAYRCPVCGCIETRYGVHFAAEHVDPEAPGFAGEHCPGDPETGEWTPTEDDES